MHTSARARERCPAGDVVTTDEDGARARRGGTIGQLSEARDQLRRRVAETQDPDAMYQLAGLEAMSGNLEAARDLGEALFRRWRAEGRRRAAATVARYLGRLMHDGFGNRSAAVGWFARGRSLLEGEGPCVELGWLELGVVGCNVADAAELAERAGRALDLARQFDDSSLECKALADLGLAHVSMGRVAEGMRRIDEAMTLIASREVVDPDVASQVTCCLVSACERSGDLGPAEAWTSVIGTPSADDESPYLFGHCRVAYGKLLCAAGRWAEADTALRLGVGAAEMSGSAMQRAQTRAAWAELRVRQGRLDEARGLLEGTEDNVDAAHARALLHLARHGPDLAAAVARQALRELNGDCLRSAPLMALLVEAALQRGDVADAADAAGRLDELAAESALPFLRAQAALARGRVAARSDPAAAAVEFQSGLKEITIGQWPLLRAALHLDLARALRRSNRADAIVEAQAALAIYERVGAPEVEDATALLRGLGVAVRGQACGASALDQLSPREREVLGCLGRGLSNPEIAEALVVSRKTVEHHVTSVLGKLGLRSRAEAAIYAVTMTS